jgi:hypothetical protein
VHHSTVGTTSSSASSDRGRAGSSAQREYERRRAKRDNDIRTRHPRIGGFLLAVREEPASMKAWSKGARGERHLGRLLDQSGVLVLHDRSMNKTSGNIDHIAIAATGIYVIDAKEYEGRVERRPSAKILRPEPDKLIVNGRDRTKLVRSVRRQACAITQALEGCEAARGLEIRPVLCFIGRNWGWFSRPFDIDGVTVIGPNRLLERLGRPGDTPDADLEQVGKRLAARLPPA